MALLVLGAAACTQAPVLPAGQPTLAAPASQQAEAPLPLPPPTEAQPEPLLPTPALPEPAIPEPTVEPTPQPGLLQLTQGGCCAQPGWSPDGGRVLFIDKPAADAPAGLWGVGLEGGPPELYTARLGLYSPGMQLVAFLQGEQTVVERLADGQQWVIPSGGRAVSFSPDGNWLAWTAGQSGPPFDTARREVWISRVDGSEAQLLLNVVSGGFSGWFPDGRLLITGRLHPEEEHSGFFALAPGSAPVEIGRVPRLRGGLLSPDGAWLAYQITATGPEVDGMWLVNTLTHEQRRLELFGAYRWRDGSRLLVIPLDLTNTSHRLWEVDASTGQARPLTDPQVTPFKVANGDWTVSPDGRRIAFLSAADFNIWLLTLPGN